jgi:hypothetical protein
MTDRLDPVSCHDLRQLYNLHGANLLINALHSFVRQEREKMTAALRAERMVKALPVYGEMCRKPEACEKLGYCPLDPTCAD